MADVPSFTQSSNVPIPSAGTTTSSDAPPSPANLVHHAKDAVAHVADKVKSRATDQLASQQKKSAGELSHVAKALRSTRDELGDNFAAPIVERAADEVERVTHFLQSASMGEVLDEVESFARREPLLFIGGAFAVGALGARFLKSSARRAAGGVGSSGDTRPESPARGRFRERMP